ncbi:MAG: hypothetical protein JRJ03_04125 [Deltaproteobacteria bacterium]|nr:hypothetical protein [Deltaproteobacteria bacterium]
MFLRRFSIPIILEAELRGAVLFTTRGFRKEENPERYSTDSMINLIL